MRATHPVAVVVMLFALHVAVADAHKSRPMTVPCPPDVAAAVAQQCPCDAATSHGDYVSCVVRYRIALLRSHCPSDGGRGMVVCAARSTCGKPTAVICCLPCEAGADCRTMRGRIARDAATCTAAGGTPAGQGSACGMCTTQPPPGAPTTTSTTSTSTTTSTTTTTTTSTTETSTTTTTTLAPGFDFGNDVEFPDASAHSPDYLLGGSFTLPRQGMLTHLCVIAKSGGPNVILALYSDIGGEPGNLVAFTAATPMTVGRMEIPTTPTALLPGTYWMMGVYDADASIGIDQSDPSVPVRYLPQSFSSPLPDPFGPAFGYTGQRFNYYIKVE